VDVVVGPRSAVLSPVEDLGLVILDEEQDESYFQRENPSYDARRGVYFRAKQDRAVHVYGSSAPSVEYYHEFGKTNRLFNILREPTNTRAEIVEHRIDRGLLSTKLTDRLNKAVQEKRVYSFRKRS